MQFKTKYESSNPFIKDGNIEIETEQRRPNLRQRGIQQTSGPTQQWRNNSPRRSYADATRTTFQRDSRNNYNTYNDKTTYIGKNTYRGNENNRTYTQHNTNDYNNTNGRGRFTENTDVRNLQNRPRNYLTQDPHQNRNMSDVDHPTKHKQARLEKTAIHETNKKPTNIF